MTLLETNLGSGSIPKRQGKVRDVYDWVDRLLLIATDRISAFDWVMPNGIPDKGRVLTCLSAVLVRTPACSQPPHLDRHQRRRARSRAGRARIARGPHRWWCARPASFLLSAWCGAILPGADGRNIASRGRSAASRSGPAWSRAIESSPIFTPATKAETGHDENVSFETMASAVGTEVAETLQSMSLEVYRIAAEHALSAGLILADTKFEWGFDDETGELLLVDEVLTPDSSRYWSLRSISSRRSAAVVRQAVRTRLARNHWLGQVEPAPRLPEDVVAKTGTSMSRRMRG